jgi:hypothetical protein
MWWSRSARRVGAVLATAAWSAAVPALGAQTATTTTKVAVDKRAADKRAAVSDSVRVLALLESESREVHAQLAALRGAYLARASWADLGDRCNPGALRVFSLDTTPAQQQAVQRTVERMEQSIISRGVGGSLTTPEARALLRLIVGWEAGIDRPRWDEDGSAVHRAVATGLTGEVPDPRSATGCLPSPAMRDTVVFVIPGFADMEFPKAPTPRVKAYFGPLAEGRLRDDFFASVGSKQPTAELSYIVVAPMVIWRDYALVGVKRPKALGGVEVGSGSDGGAAYLLRRVGAEWRLLSVVRSWGS